MITVSVMTAFIFAKQQAQKSR